MNVLQEPTHVINMLSALTQMEALAANVNLVTVEMDLLAQVSHACICGWMG